MSTTTDLDFSELAPIFVLPTNFTDDQLHSIEEAIYNAGGELTYSPQEARIFIGKVRQKKRAAFELRSHDVWTEESELPVASSSRKRKFTANEVCSIDFEVDSTPAPANQTLGDISLASLEKHVVVLKNEWLQQSLDSGKFKSYRPFLVYAGRLIEKPIEASTVQAVPVTFIDAKPVTHIVHKDGPSRSSPYSSPEHSRQEEPNHLESGHSPRSPLQNFNPRRFRNQTSGQGHHRTTLTSALAYPTLKRTTTSEHDFFEGNALNSLPPLPPWVLEPHPRANYACCRSTLKDPTNQAFIHHLIKIKEARDLTLDEIGVRAYSTSIASLNAYPFRLSNPGEITGLPGCSEKIATLWAEWYTSAALDAPDSERHLAVTDSLETDGDLKHLRLFYNIWGVGAETARKFYFDLGWKDLDDVIEFGWNSGQLSRVQQIGVKFYNEFQEKISRREVEQIADVILEHARLCRDLPKEWWSNEENGFRGNWAKADDGRADESWDARDMVCVIVGGYRRGKTESNDVDVILSHRNEELTKDLVVDVLQSLEASGHITHTLTLHTSASGRDQQTLPYRGKAHASHGFDTLDKAFCVWQDPVYDEHAHTKNPNIHRRVDIIVSPWRTIGAAVLGWSGATTFERDIRRWCRKEKGWKFDSSGVRNRGNGAVLDFESPRVVNNGKQREGEEIDNHDGWEDRERRLMEGLGISWRPACQRFTG